MPDFWDDLLGTGSPSAPATAPTDFWDDLLAPKPTQQEPIDFWDSLLATPGGSSDSEWEDLGIFERNRTTGETRLKEKPGQLGGIGGGVLEKELEKKISIPEPAKAPDLNISYKDAGILPGLGLPGLIAPGLIKSLPGGEYVGELGAAASSGAMYGAQMASDVAGTVHRVNENVVGGLLDLVGAPDEAKTSFHQEADKFGGYLNTADQYIDAGRKLLLSDPESSGYVGDVTSSFKELISEPSLEHLGAFAADVPPALAEQVGQMEAMFFGGTALGGGNLASSATKATSVAMGVGQGAQVAAETFNQLDDAGVNSVVAGLTALGSGALQGALESWGTMEMLGGKLVAEKLIKKWNTGIINSVILRGFSSALTEGGEEAGQQFIDNIAKGLPPNWDKLPEKSLKDLLNATRKGAGDAAIGGGIVGFFLGGIGGASEQTSTIKPDATQVPPTATPERITGIANGGQVILDQETKDFIAGGNQPTPGEVAAAGELGNRIAEDAGMRDDGDLSTVIDRLNKDIIMAREDPNKVTRNRTAAAISARIDEIITMMEGGQAAGLNAEQMAPLFDALDSLSSFSKARAKWATNVRKKIFDAAETQAKANAVPVSEETADALGKALQTTVQKAADGTKERVLQVGQEIQKALQAATMVADPGAIQADIANAQEAQPTPEELQQHTEFVASVNQAGQQALEAAKRRLSEGGDWAWIGLDPHLIENLDKVDWEHIARRVSEKSKESASETLEPIASDLADKTDNTLLKTAKRMFTLTKEMANKQLLKLFPNLGSTDYVAEVERVFKEMASGTLADSKIGYLAAMSKSFGLQELAPERFNLDMSLPFEAQIESAKGALRAAGFSEETLSQLDEDIAKIVYLHQNIARTGAVLNDHRLEFAQLAIPAAAKLIVLEPERAKGYSIKMANEYADHVISQSLSVAKKTKQDALDLISTRLLSSSKPNQASAVTSARSDALALGTMLMEKLLTHGGKGIDALMFLSGVDTSENRQRAVGQSTDEIVSFVYRTLTGRDAPFKEAAYAVVRNAAAGIRMVPGPHSVLDALRTESPSVQVSTIAAVDAMADRFVGKGRGSKQDFYSQLVDRFQIETTQQNLGIHGFIRGPVSSTKHLSNIGLGELRDYGKRAITIFTSRTSDGGNAVTVLHESMHALEETGILGELLDPPERVAVEKLVGNTFANRKRWTSDQRERLARAFEVFLATRAAPSSNLTSAFHAAKRFMSQQIKVALQMSPKSLNALSKQKVSDVSIDVSEINKDVARAFYTLLNSSGLSAEALDALGPTNYMAATIEEAVQKATGGKQSIIAAFVSNALQVEETVARVEEGSEESLFRKTSDDSPDSQVGGIDNLASEDIKDHVKKVQEKAEKEAVIFPKVEESEKKKAKKEAKKPVRKKQRRKRSKNMRVSKPESAKAQAIIDKVQSDVDSGRMSEGSEAAQDASLDALDMYHGDVLMGQTPIDSAEKLTLQNFRKVLPEKIANWYRMMQSNESRRAGRRLARKVVVSQFSKEAGLQRWLDEHGMGMVAMHIGNLAGVINRAMRITKVPLTVYDRESGEFRPIPGATETFEQIFEDLGETLKPLADKVGVSMDRLMDHFVVYLSATRQMEVWNNNLKRIAEHKAAVENWKKSGQKGDKPAPPVAKVVLDAKWQEASELALNALKMAYGEKGVAQMDAFAERISRWGHHAIIGKFLHSGLIAQTDYDNMVRAGQRWIPFQRLAEYVSDGSLPEELMPDGSLLEAVKFLTMDISGGLKDPITEIAKRAAAADAITLRQAAKNEIGELLLAQPDWWATRDGIGIATAAKRVTKEEYDNADESVRMPPVGESYKGRDGVPRTRVIYKIRTPVTKEQFAKWDKWRRADVRNPALRNAYVFASWKDGKPTYVVVTDPALSQALVRMNNTQTQMFSRVMKGLSWATRQFVGRPLTTSMSFLYNAPIRDMFAGFARSAHGQIPVVDFLFGLFQSLGVIFPTLAQEFPETFVAARDYQQGLGGMATLQGQMHEVARLELSTAFKRGYKGRIGSELNPRWRRVLSGLGKDLYTRLQERGVAVGTGLNGRTRRQFAAEAVMLPWNGLLFAPEMLAEAFELSYRLGERRLALAEEIKDPRLVGYYTARNAKPSFDGKIRAGFRGVKHRLVWNVNKRRHLAAMEKDPTYVIPESDLPVVFSGTERDNATRQVTLDFGSRGAWATPSGLALDGNLFSKIWVFWNPKMQDAYSSMKLLRPLFDKTSPSHLKKKGWTFAAKMVAGTLIPALAQMAYWWDDDDWWAKSFLERVAYIHLWKNDKGEFIRIPAGISFATLLFRDMVMAGFFQATEKDPQGMSKFLDRFFDQAPFGLPFRALKAGEDSGSAIVGLKQLGYDLAPTAGVQPVIALSENYDGFFGEEISRPQMYSQELPTERDADRFGWVQNKVARWFGVEPAQADYFLRRGTPGLYSTALSPVSMINKLAGATGVMSEEMGNVGSAMSYSGNLTPWKSKPQWGPSNEWVQDFNKLWLTTEKARTSWQRYKDAGHEKRAAELEREYPLIQNQNYYRMKYVRDTMSDMYKTRSAILADQSLSPEEKSALLITVTDQPMALLAMEELRGVLNYAAEDN